MKKPAFFITCIILIIIMLSIVQVIVSNNLSTTGIELAKYQEDINTYQKENTILHQELLEKSSYTYIASKAAELGFVEDKSRVYLTDPIPVAFKQ